MNKILPFISNSGPFSLVPAEKFLCHQHRPSLPFKTWLLLLKSAHADHTPRGSPARRPAYDIAD